NAMKSDELKDDLLSPKIPLGFAYENQLLGLEEVDQWYYNSRDCRGHDTLKTDGVVSTCLSIRDPKSHPEGGEREGVGFLKEAAMFTVTDDLKITPISPVSSLLLLNKLEVPLSDVGKLTVRIGREEASRLLVAAFLSEHPLTDVFMRREVLKDPHISKEPKKETE
ncbi:hypothetical protein Tsubulata_037003, partial [Turnera subulata]